MSVFPVHARNHHIPAQPFPTCGLFPVCLPVQGSHYWLLLWPLPAVLSLHLCACARLPGPPALLTGWQAPGMHGACTTVSSTKSSFCKLHSCTRCLTSCGLMQAHDSAVFLVALDLCGLSFSCASAPWKLAASKPPRPGTLALASACTRTQGAVQAQATSTPPKAGFVTFDCCVLTSCRLPLPHEESFMGMWMEGVGSWNGMLMEQSRESYLPNYQHYQAQFLQRWEPLLNMTPAADLKAMQVRSNSRC